MTTNKEDTLSIAEKTAIENYLFKIHQEETQEALDLFIGFAKAHNVNLIIDSKGIRTTSTATIKELMAVQVYGLAKVKAIIDILYIFQHHTSATGKERESIDELTLLLAKIMQEARIHVTQPALNNTIH